MRPAGLVQPRMRDYLNLSSNHMVTYVVEKCGVSVLKAVIWDYVVKLFTSVYQKVHSLKTLKISIN